MKNKFIILIITLSLLTLFLMSCDWKDMTVKDTEKYYMLAKDLLLNDGEFEKGEYYNEKIGNPSIWKLTEEEIEKEKQEFIEKVIFLLENDEKGVIEGRIIFVNPRVYSVYLSFSEDVCKQFDYFPDTTGISLEFNFRNSILNEVFLMKEYEDKKIIEVIYFDENFSAYSQ